MKMYFYYGVMGSSKTANALMKKFNFEEQGRQVALLKPKIDDRDGHDVVKSRVGLSCKADLIYPQGTIAEAIRNYKYLDVIIVDESQFLTKSQVDELRHLVDNGIMVMCYGLKTDYMGHLFEGSQRILEVTDTIREIQYMCQCGRKAIINARYQDGKIVYQGNQIDIGGNNKYKSLCHQCWVKGRV